MKNPAKPSPAASTLLADAAAASVSTTAVRKRARSEGNDLSNEDELSGRQAKGKTIPTNPSSAAPTSATDATSGRGTTTAGHKRAKSEGDAIPYVDEPCEWTANDETNAFRSGDETTELPKDTVLRGIAVGSHGNVMLRHRNLLDNISSLIPRPSNIEVDDNESSFLERAMSCHMLYMKWVDQDELLYMWIGDEQVFKLELHAVFEFSSEHFTCKNPMLSFSHGFENGEHWIDLKHILEQIFASSKNGSTEPDCLYAFTRVDDTVHVRIYQLPSIDQSSPEDEMSLTKIGPSFFMKPVEVKCGEVWLPIFRSERLMYEENSLLNLKPMSVSAPSSGSLISHTVKHSLIQDILLLPHPPDVSYLNGFNTDLTEFLQRFPATRQDVVPGSNPETEYRDITDNFRVFSRSLILITGAVRKRNLCIRGLTRDKILVKRGVARLHGVKLIQYTEARALTMFRRVASILKKCIPEGIRLPADVKFVLKLLRHDPLESYDLIANSPVWMSAWDRCQYLEVTYSIFKSDLSLEQKIKFSETPGLQQMIRKWRAKMERNVLLYDVVNHNLKMPKDYASKTEKDKADDRLRVKNRKLEKLKETALGLNISATRSNLRSLLRSQEFFAKCRHSSVHLHESAEKVM